MDRPANPDRFDRSLRRLRSFGSAPTPIVEECKILLVAYYGDAAAVAREFELRAEDDERGEVELR